MSVSSLGGEEWKCLGDKLGLTLAEICYLDKRTRNPAEAVLTVLEQNAPKSTVGYLYNTLVECDMPTMADLM